MWRLISVFVFLSVIGYSNCSSQILRKDLYTFEVGDYFGVEYRSTPGFQSEFLIEDHLYHILTRNYNGDSSIVNYSVERQNFEPALSQGNTSSYVIDTIIVSHSNLNDTFSTNHIEQTFGTNWMSSIFYFADSNGCLSQSNSLAYYPCHDMNLWQFSYGMTPTGPMCFEPIISSYYVVQGAGGPYGSKWQPGDPSSSSINRKLVYLKKNGIQCGNFKPYFVELQELARNQIVLFPQPAHEKFTIQSESPIKRIYVLDIKGIPFKTIESINKNTFETLDWPAGMYFLKIETAKDGIYLKRIMII